MLRLVSAFVNVDQKHLYKQMVETMKTIFLFVYSSCHLWQSQWFIAIEIWFSYQLSLQNRQERRILLLNGGWDLQRPTFVQFHFLKKCPCTSLKVALMNAVSTDIVSIFQHVTILSLVSFVLSGWTVALQLIYGPLQWSYTKFSNLITFKVSLDHSVHVTHQSSASENLTYMYLGEPHLINSQKQALYCSLHLQQDLPHLQILYHFPVNYSPTDKQRVLQKKLQNSITCSCLCFLQT